MDAKKRLSNMFVKIDTNNDGTVTLDELKKEQEAKGFPWEESDMKMFETMDKDKNGKISEDGKIKVVVALEIFSLFRY